MLRQFLHFDESLIDDFLAQLEGGQYDEERQRLQETSDGTTEGGADLKVVKGSVTKGSSSENERERTLRQVRASKFDRLHRALTAASPPLLRDVSDVDESGWEGLRRGELVECDANVALPTFVKLLSSVSGLGSLMPLIDMVGAGADVPDDLREMMAGLSAVSDTFSGEKVTLLTNVGGGSTFRFVCHVARSDLLVPESELEGEVTVVGKIQRKLRRGETEPLVTIPGLAMLPADQKAALTESMQSESPELGDMVVAYPAAVLTVLAIHR